MDIWHDDRTTLRERDSLFPVRKLLRLTGADFKEASPSDFESSSIRCFPLSIFSALRCLFTLYTTAVIVVSVFHYEGKNWLSWLPFAAQVGTGLYFMMAGIMSQVHYLIVVCIKGNLCKVDKNSNVTGSEEVAPEALPYQGSSDYSVVRETTFKDGEHPRKSMSSSLLEVNPNEHEEEHEGSLTIFHHIFWMVADIVPCLNLVLTFLALIEDPNLFKHNTNSMNQWYVAVNIYLLSTSMLVVDFILGKIPKRITRLVIPCLFSLAFFMIVKLSKKYITIVPQWLPPLNCSTEGCESNQELYVIIGIPIAYCLFLFLYWIKNTLMTFTKRGEHVNGEWV